VPFHIRRADLEFRFEPENSSMKPLFIPLKTAYFDMFREGSKSTEYRVYGPRWNERTCKPGRPVVLSKGYGKAHRLEGVVEDFTIDPEPWRNAAFVGIYGNSKELQAACIRIALRRNVAP
jgi:hypothetical protein